MPLGLTVFAFGFKYNIGSYPLNFSCNDSQSYTTFLSFKTTLFYLLLSLSLPSMKSFFALGLAAAVSAAPTAITPRTDAPFGNKKGLAYNDGAITSVLSTSGSATWAYNWGTASNAPKFQ